MKRHALAIAIVCLCSACTALPVTEQRHAVEYLHQPEVAPSDFGDTFDWQAKSPLDFLALLKAQKGMKTYIVHGVHRNWVQESDIPGLAALLDSPEPCASVARSTSSWMDFSGSTVGDEAAFLIMGFQKGEYPPGLNSTRPKRTQQEKDRLRKGWAE